MGNRLDINPEEVALKEESWKCWTANSEGTNK